jgi:hypothetical protein
VLVVVAVNTQVFPVRSVRRIIQVISVFVVNRQEMPGFFVELSSAFGADEAMDLEGAFSIITPWRLGFLQFFKGFFNGLIVSRFLRLSLVMNSIGLVFHINGSTRNFRSLLPLALLLFFGVIATKVGIQEGITGFLLPQE